MLRHYQENMGRIESGAGTAGLIEKTLENLS
jgi:hypothetical protein